VYVFVRVCVCICFPSFQWPFCWEKPRVFFFLELCFKLCPVFNYMFFFLFFCVLRRSCTHQHTWENDNIFFTLCSSFSFVSLYFMICAQRHTTLPQHTLTDTERT
jgi:hypothetical protein